MSNTIYILKIQKTEIGHYYNLKLALN